MNRKVTGERPHSKIGMTLRILNGGKRDDSPVTTRGTRETVRDKRDQRAAAKEFVAAVADIPRIDYEQLRADLDAIADPGRKDWYAWAARTDRHIRRGALD
ncbi:MAG TPA: hypothetical protein VF085_05790 [Solirubrobacterales bacterium]